MLPYIGGYLSSYALFASLGLFCMMLVIYIRNKIMPFYTYLLFVGTMVVGAVVGSKALFIATQIPDMAMHFSLKYVANKIITSGFVFYGGLLGAVLGCILFAKLHSYVPMQMLNLAAPGYSIFHAFGRIGCFFAGCCYGKEAKWGVAMWEEPEILRIPVQLFESAFLFLMTYFLLKMEKKGERHLFEIYILAYAVFRFFIEFWRGDSIRGVWGVLSTSQWISIFILAFFLTMHCMTMIRRRIR